MDRKQILKKTKRLVIKIGSGVLTDKKGVKKSFFSKLAKQIQILRKKNIEVILVSSGAVACGMDVMRLTKRPSKLAQKQAAASIGQPVLIQNYTKAFSSKKINVAQILLTREDLNDRHRFLCAKRNLMELFNQKVIPIVNENDAVSVDEIQFGDNDYLSALVAHLVDADLLLILTDIDALYDSNPHQNKEAKRIPLVENIDDKTFQLASGTQSQKSVGGMTTKIKAAKQAASYGMPTLLVDGNNPKIISQVFDEKDCGTLFLPSDKKISDRKYWIAYTLKAKGQLIVDEGAAFVLTNSKKSLLASGITQLTGNFEMGDVVDIICNNKIIAKGLVGYHSVDLDKIKGVKSTEIEKILGYKNYDEVIDRDDLVIMV